MAPLDAWCEGLRALLPGRYHNIASGLDDGSGLRRVGGGGRSLGGLRHEIFHASLDKHEDAHALGDGRNDLRRVLEDDTMQGGGDVGGLALLPCSAGGAAACASGMMARCGNGVPA